MPKGSKDGSIMKVPARREGGHIVKPAHWIVRRRFTNGEGKHLEKKRIAHSASEAMRLKREIDREIEQVLSGETKPKTAQTFADLVTFAKARDLKPAEYLGETKIAGLRSWRSVLQQLKPLEDWFGDLALSAIGYDHLADYKHHRLNSPILIKRGGEIVETRQRSIASVNRELALLRHLLFTALRERWISDHPFHRGRPLIQVSAEVSRMRILSFEEEERLLAQCVFAVNPDKPCLVTKRAHLRLQIIFAIETGMRRNEQLTLELRDVDLNDRIISLRAFNSKTAQPRVIPIFERLARELAASPLVKREPIPGALLFLDGNPKHAFANACVDAAIDGLRWHDLRHTAATRMLHNYGLQAAEVMKILGHSNLKTFLRYVNIDREVARSIRERVDARRGDVPIAEAGEAVH